MPDDPNPDPHPDTSSSIPAGPPPAPAVAATPVETGLDPSDDDPGLSPQQEEAIRALVREQTHARAAQAASVSERTLYRWLKLPKFKRAYNKLRRESFDLGTAMAQKLTPFAVNVLGKIMTSPTAKDTVKASAAIAVIKLGRVGLELDDMQARVRDLEATVAELTKDRDDE